MSDVWLGLACPRCRAVSDSAGVCRCWNEAGELEGRIKDCSWACFTALMMAVFIFAFTHSPYIMASKTPFTLNISDFYVPPSRHMEKVSILSRLFLCVTH